VSFQQPAELLAFHARRLAALAIKHGGAQHGQPVDVVAKLYVDTHQTLQWSSAEHGEEVMVTVADLVAMALDQGLVYPGTEATDLMRGISERLHQYRIRPGGTDL